MCCVRENQSPWNFNNNAPPTNPIGIRIQKTAAILKISLAIVKFNQYFKFTFNIHLFVKNVDNANILKIFNILIIILKKKILIFLISGIGMVLKFVGVFQAKTIKFQLSLYMDLAPIEIIGGTI